MTRALERIEGVREPVGPERQEQRRDLVASLSRARRETEQALETLRATGDLLQQSRLAAKLRPVPPPQARTGPNQGPDIQDQDAQSRETQERDA